jgi:hypothetical protein
MLAVLVNVSYIVHVSSIGNVLYIVNALNVSYIVHVSSIVNVLYTVNVLGHCLWELLTGLIHAYEEEDTFIWGGGYLCQVLTLENWWPYLPALIGVRKDSVCCRDPQILNSQCQKRPTTVSKETYYSVKRDLGCAPDTNSQKSEP